VSLTASYLSLPVFYISGALHHRTSTEIDFELGSHLTLRRQELLYSPHNSLLALTVLPRLTNSADGQFQRRAQSTLWHRNVNEDIVRKVLSRDIHLNLDNNIELLRVDLLHKGQNAERQFEVVCGAIREQNKLAVWRVEDNTAIKLKGICARALVEADVVDTDTAIA